MNYLQKMTYYNDLTTNDIYIHKIGAQNILFIGGCRSFVYAIYLEEICKISEYFKNAQFGFSAIGVHIIDLFKRTKTINMTNVIENADIIICEQIRNYSILNTSNKCEQNIFNNFKIKPTCKIIQIPNLEFKYYKNDLVLHNYNIDEIKIAKEESLNKFIIFLKKYGFNNFSNYIINNIISKRLFITFNHPSNYTILEFIYELCENVWQQTLLHETILSSLHKIQIFEFDSNKTKISIEDYQLGLNSSVQ
jgi:hypothetical protein